MPRRCAAIISPMAAAKAVTGGVGDVHNTPGHSMFVRLTGGESGKGAAGKWTDGATGEHDDLLDIIWETCGYADFRDVADEARRFLSLPHPEPEPAPGSAPWQRAARFTCTGRLARGSTALVQGVAAARRHHRRSLSTSPRYYGVRRNGMAPLSIRAAYYRPDEGAASDSRPAMIAAVTGLDGAITGAHRTWLDPSGRDKAAVEWPRRGDGPSAWQRRPLRRGGRCAGGRRGHRDHAVAALRAAQLADGGGALGRAISIMSFPSSAKTRRRQGRHMCFARRPFCWSQRTTPRARFMPGGWLRCIARSATA